ncbi:MAG TPA: LUD domain-containing protein [Epulopiscium sp.]|nr:LUD domain-containing protein [Candidatus Epulonipiscium sp.]
MWQEYNKSGQEADLNYVLIDGQGNPTSEIEILKGFKLSKGQPVVVDNKVTWYVDIKEIFRQSFLSDTYLTSSNAITEAGELYNVDGNGNRVAAMLYGPDQVIVVVGINKLVKNIDQAILRVEGIAAPANNKRLNKNNPCTTVGHCTDCKNEGRICNQYTVIRRGAKGRITVIIVNKELGY